MSLYKPKNVRLKGKSVDEWMKTIDENWNQLKQIDQDAKEKGELLWRYIQEPFADGQAIYQIVVVRKNRYNSLYRPR